MAPRGVWAGLWRLAVLLLTTNLMGSCLVPQTIDELKPTPTPVRAAPVFQLSSASPQAAVTCIDNTPATATPFNAPVANNGAALTLRWFLNYSVGPCSLVTNCTVPLTIQGKTDFTLSAEDITSLAEIQSADLNLGNTGPGVYALEAVVTDGDGFNDNNFATPNRGALDGFNVVSFKWVIEYLGEGTCGATE